MKILIISEALDNSAAGRIFKIFVDSLSFNPKIQLFIISNKIDWNLKTRIKSIELGKSGLTNSRFYKLIFAIFAFDYEGLSRVLAGLKHYRQIRKSFQPDVILVLTSGYCYNSIDFGVKISEKYKIPLAIHSVDPMPAPAGWNEHPFLRRAIIKYVGNRFRKANYLSFTNNSMLDYQIDLLGISSKTKTEVLLNPAQHNPIKKEFTNNNSRFLYLGSFYNKRKPDYLIEAFICFLKINPDAEIFFVGVGNNKIIYNASEKYFQIKVFDWTNEPEKYLEMADVLIDIDADIENDVFIASKLNNYILLDKPILSISPEGSPARNLLKDCKETIFFSNNSAESIYEKLTAIGGFKPNLDIFNERNSLRMRVNIENITVELFEHLQSIVRN